MLIIYRVTPKGSTTLIDKKIKHVVVKNGKVKILDNKDYIPDSSSDFTFEVGKSQAKEFKKYIENNLEDFKKDFPAKYIENNLEDFKKDFPAKFIELLKDKFDIQKQQENYTQVIVSKPDEDEKQLLEAKPQSIPSAPPTFLRPNSMKFESSHEILKKTLSLHDLPNENSSKISRPETPIDLSSSQNSIHSQDLKEQASLIASAQKICLFFIQEKHNNNLFKMERHGSHIKDGYFNGSKKSEILLSITELAAQIRKNSNDKDNISSTDQLKTLKQNISKLDAIINNKQNLKILERYRGFSPFKCLATLWGGGKVKSKEYVEQLRNELNPLINEVNEVLSARPTV